MFNSLSIFKCKIFNIQHELVIDIKGILHNAYTILIYYFNIKMIM